MPPSVLLEPIFTTHGDTLYRTALLLEANERRATRLLHALAADLAGAAPLNPPGDVELLARLVALARAAEAKLKPERRRTRRPTDSAIYRSLHSQPLESRLALGLHLLLGYDPERIAAVLGSDPPSATRLLETAMRAVAPAAGTDLPDRVSSDHCYAVRAALIDAAGRERHSAAVRGHLAGCSPCRSFDQRWLAIGQAVEAALRQELRPRRLPDDLFQRLISYGTPRTRDRLRPYRFAIPLLAVLALVGALVLPGFTQRSVTVVDRTDDSVAVDPNTLLTQALELHTQPPDAGPAIWHGRFETLWYFSEQTVAPLHADLWLDRSNPARHRAQITHRDGGAPYELQIGSGDDRLYYALDAAYAPVLYSALNTGALPERPRLNAFNSSPTEQRQALEERLHAGPWMIPPFYLEQALNADDVRVLGRQRDGERTVQIVSFAGVSPLSLPNAEPERVTVLLALDNTDGRLRSATELVGPPGGTQVSRVTWRLIDEEQFEGDQSVRRAFSIDSAWNGLGDFTTVPPQQLADPALPFLSTTNVADPAAIVGFGVIPIWMPTAPPPGVDRAVIVGGFGGVTERARPESVIYLGPDRRLSLRYGRNQPLVGETLTVGVWAVTLRPERGNVYNAFLQRTPEHSPQRIDAGDIRIFVDAQGFTRDELISVIADLQPFDLESLSAQDALFFSGDQTEFAARTMLLALVHTFNAVEPSRIGYTRWRATSRPDPARQDPRDPYSPRPYAAVADEYQLEHWFVPDGVDPVLLTRITALPSTNLLLEQYQRSERTWWYDAFNDTTSIYAIGPSPLVNRMPAPFSLALSLLSNPEAELTLVSTDNAAQRIEAHITTDPNTYFAFLLPERRITSSAMYSVLEPARLTAAFEVNTTGELQALRIYAADGSAATEQVLLDTYELIERTTLAPEEAPSTLAIPTPPESSLVRDFSGLEAPFALSTPIDLNATSTLAPFPVYQWPQPVAELRKIEQNLAVAGMGYRYPFFYPDDDLLTAVEAGFAVRLTYEPTPDTSVRITQGPATTLRAYLRSSSQAFWENPEPITLVVAGREAEGWIGTLGDRTRLIVTLDEHMLIIDATPADFASVLPLLNELQAL